MVYIYVCNSIPNFQELIRNIFSCSSMFVALACKNEAFVSSNEAFWSYSKAAAALFVIRRSQLEGVVQKGLSVYANN